MLEKYLESFAWTFFAVKEFNKFLYRLFIIINRPQLLQETGVFFCKSGVVVRLFSLSRHFAFYDIKWNLNHQVMSEIERVIMLKKAIIKDSWLIQFWQSNVFHI